VVTVSAAQHAKIINLPVGHAHSHTALPCAGNFTGNASALDNQHDNDFNPDMVTDEGTSTG
jgi:hypothetical protein